MACFVACVAHGLILALTGDMPILLAVPTYGLGGALSRNVPITEKMN